MQNKYLVSRDTELTPLLLGKLLNKFNTSDLPKLNKSWDYYKGKQKILSKQPTDVGKPCNKILVNFCKSIVDNYSGYLTGIPISYRNDNFTEVFDVLKYNDYVTEDNEYLRQALIFGKAFEVCYIDADGKQRFRLFDARECLPVYDNTLDNELLYVVRFYREDLLQEQSENYIVEVYSSKSIKTYRSNSGFSSFTLLQEVPHYYQQVPITVFSLNTDEECIFEQILSLQDAYNNLLSDEVDDFDAFCDSYLVLKGCVADDEDLDKMKRNRVLILDPDASAEYLTKAISDTQIENMLTNINDKIHRVANSPDFSDEKFLAQSGIAMRYKLVGFENTAASIEANMRKALIKRIELLSEILKLTDIEYIWRDVEIVFTRNLPFDTAEAVNLVASLQGIVSQKTLLSQLPFIHDVDEELKAVAEEKQNNMELYRMGTGFDDSVEDEDELLAEERTTAANQTV